MAQILDGLATAATIKKELRERIAALKKRGITPGLGTLLVGNDPASLSYVGGKHRDCAEVGIRSFRENLSADVSESDVREAINRLNNNPEVTGYILQLPLPAGMDENALLEAIDPEKDADGLHPVNLGRLVLGGETASPLPCTPAGIIELLRRYQVPLTGKQVTVIGRGVTVGRPLGLLLTRKGVDATAVLTHSRTVNLANQVRLADVVVAAVGVAHLVQAEWVKPGATVLDVGVTRARVSATGRAILRGDVHPDVAKVANWLSPNPGGVGPMTRAMLLANVVTLAEQTLNKP